MPFTIGNEERNENKFSFRPNEPIEAMSHAVTSFIFVTDSEESFVMLFILKMY